MVLFCSDKSNKNAISCSVLETEEEKKTLILWGKNYNILKNKEIRKNNHEKK
jgi:hypothetical protein